MRLRTDDEVYRVDAVWLGPEGATMPWRARYVAWFVGGLMFLLIMGVQRQVGIGFGFFSTGWAVVAAIVLTRLICSRITYERPLTSVLWMWRQELLAPRRPPPTLGGVVGGGQVRLRRDRPRPKPDSHDQRSPRPAVPASRPARSRPASRP